MKAGLDKTNHKESQAELAFYCPTHKLHIATISKSKHKLWVCSKDSKKCDNLTPDQTVWLSGPGELVSAVDMLFSALPLTAPQPPQTEHSVETKTKPGQFIIH